MAYAYNWVRTVVNYFMPNGRILVNVGRSHAFATMREVLIRAVQLSV